jgi:vacuolar-type H+-ATPase subunit H
MPHVNQDKSGLTPSIDQEVELLLEVAEQVKKKAEEEAREIIEAANRKAVVVSKNSSQDEENSSNNKTELNGKGQREYGICSQEVFRVILQRERSRTDRNGHELSLVIFDFDEEKNVKSVNMLIKVLKSRARSIDRFGWYGEDRIGITLPNTPYKGGMKFAHDVSKTLIEKKDVPSQF